MGWSLKKFVRGVTKSVSKPTKWFNYGYQKKAFTQMVSGQDQYVQAPSMPDVAGDPEIGTPAPSTPPDPPTAATEKDEAAAAAIAANKDRRRTLLSGFEGISAEAPVKKKRLLGD